MKTSSRATFNLEDLRPVTEALRDLDICMLTSRSGDSLHSRPMSNNRQVEYDGDTWFFAFRDSALAQEIEADPRISLSYAAGEQGVWLAIEADAALVDDDDQKRERWFDELDRWFPDGAGDPKVTLIRANARRIRSWGAAGDLDLRPTI